MASAKACEKQKHRFRLHQTLWITRLSAESSLDQNSAQLSDEDVDVYVDAISETEKSCVDIIFADECTCKTAFSFVEVLEKLKATFRPATSSTINDTLLTQEKLAVVAVVPTVRPSLQI